MSLAKEFTKGIVEKNPLFALVLGLCPSLAVTTSLENAVWMGLCVIFVLTLSNLFVSLLNPLFPKKIRIPCFIVIIASFVTIVQFLMAAYQPTLNDKLGIFIPLIVVNCIILGRAEAFASKNGALASVVDGLGMGTGYLLAISVVATIREVLGNGSIYGARIMPWFSPEEGAFAQPAQVLTAAPGAFLVLGLVLGFMAYLSYWKKNKLAMKKYAEDSTIQTLPQNSGE